MILQKLILKDVVSKNIVASAHTKSEDEKASVQTEELYVRLKESVICEEGISFSKDATAEFSTVQNAFSVGKWKKYTVIENLFFLMEFVGAFQVSVVHAYLNKGEVVQKTILTKTVSAARRHSEKIEIGELKEEGVIYIQLEAHSESAYLYSGFYGTKDIMPTQAVKMMINICTYKREEYVKHNIKLIKQELLENQDSPCYDKLWVHISDNASSLAGIVDTQKGITVHKNKNLGGVGGFTRGIIETQRLPDEETFTHILLMDDDAVISTNAIEVNFRLLSYLKPEYFKHTIGGKLMVLETPHIQFEVGAEWNNGDVKALKSGKDMRKLTEVLDSETEDKHIDYQGWWYACIPLSEIGQNNLPLPLFIHRDDVEYGLRVGQGRFIYMNAICIWHESFAGKLSGTLEYYDVRNQCIVNAIHCPLHTKAAFKKQIKTIIMNNILKFRYRYVEYNIRAVEDFCKGIEWLRDGDAIELHQTLLENNYKTEKIQELIRKCGITEEQIASREKNIKRPDYITRLFRKMVFHGKYFSDDDKLVITGPQISIHQLYRKKRTIIVDNYGNGLYLEKDKKKHQECIKKLNDVLRLIDEKYDEAVMSYRNGYQELISRDFWERYLIR